MDKEFGSFRKATFGFNRKDVIAYIEKMRNESYEYKKQVDQTVKSLNEKIRELENAARLMDDTAPDKADAREQTPALQYGNDIGLATKHLRSVADELCRSLGDFMEKLSEKGLFDSAKAEEEAVTENTVIAEEETLGLVDGILSSISYLGANAFSKEKVGVKTEKTETTDIADILSTYSFLK